MFLLFLHLLVFMGPWLAPNCKTDFTELGNAQGGGHVRSGSE